MPGKTKSVKKELALPASKRRRFVPTVRSSLLTLPEDLWPIIRALAGPDVACALVLTCRGLRRLVATPTFWSDFQHSDFELKLASHRRILLWLHKSTLLDSLCIEQPVQSSDLRVLSGFSVAKLSVANQEAEPLAELLQAFSSVRSLSLWNCLDLTSLARLRSPASLLALSIQTDHQHVDELVARALPQLTKLIKLRFWYCPYLTDQALRTAGLRDLQTLTLLQCAQITGECLGRLPGCQRFRKLRLSRCPGITDDGLDALRACQSLTSLSLEFCTGLTGALHLPKLQNLVILKCANVTDTSLAFCLRHCSSLQNLEVDGCDHLSGAWLAELWRCPALRTLDLQSCRLLNTLDQVQYCGSLRKLLVYDCPGLTQERIESLLTGRPDLEVASQFN